MSVKIIKQEDSKILLEFNISKENFNQALDTAFKTNASKFKLQGFRAGKAPRSAVEKIYGEHVLYDDAFSIVASEEYKKAITDNNLEVVSNPEVDIKEIGKDKDLVFNITVYIKPEVVVKDYMNLKIDKVNTKITNSDIEAELKNIQIKNARIIEKEGKVESGNIVIIDFEGFVDNVAFEGGKAEKYELEIGSNSFIPGFEDQIIGMQKGESKDINVKFPEEYHAENLKGKDSVFKVVLHEIKKKEFPDIDDEFAKDVSEFDTLKEYKDFVKADLEKKKELSAKAEKETKVIDALIEKVQVNIPEPMIHSQIHNMITEFEQNLAYQGLTLEQYMKMLNLDHDSLDNQFKASAIKDIKLNLAIEYISIKENIEISEEEIKNKVQELITSYGKDEKDIDSMLKNENVINYTKDKLKQEKVFNLLVSNSVEK